MRILTLLPLLLFAFSNPPVFATTFIERPFPDTVQEAPIMVRGKVGNSYTNWAQSSDGARRIYTFTELQVEEALKGNVPTSTTIVMREMGGEKDGMGMQVSGTAQFQRGEDIVMTLSGPNPDGSYDVRGMMMGKYNVERDEDGKEFLSGPGLGMGGHGHGHGENEMHAERNDTSGDKKWSLDALRELIKKQDTRESIQKAPSLPKVAPSPVLAPAPMPSPVAAAPQLQISPAEPSPAPLRQILLGLGAIGGAGIVVAWVLRRKRNT